MMLPKYNNLLIYPLLILMLTSCTHTHFIQDRGKDYLNATSIPPIQIPPGMSSSTIESHYPVSERDYPAESKSVKLIPPNLPCATKAKSTDVLMTAQNRTSNSSTQGSYTAPVSETAALTPAEKKQVETHYYDPYTRSSTGGVGRPIGSLIKNILPKNSPATQQQVSTTTQTSATNANNNQPMTTVNNDAPTNSSQPAVPGKSLGSIIKSIKSFWSSGKKEDSTISANTETQTAAASSQSVATSAKDIQPQVNATKMPNMYYDRYTRR